MNCAKYAVHSTRPLLLPEENHDQGIAEIQKECHIFCSCNTLF
jgi:hypothetical protein